MAQQVHVGPDELARFAKQLKEFNEELRQRSSRVDAQFRGLGDTWRDQEHRKFADEFQETMRVIERFLKVSDKHVPFLARKAERAREYLRQR